jgi:hypothetical protein
LSREEKKLNNGFFATTTEDQTRKNKNKEKYLVNEHFEEKTKRVLM